MDNGVYGRKETFADACVTVTEFLDDLYDQGGNYNQAFLEFERRLQEYFGYEPRDTENGQDAQDAAEFVVYHDGLEWGRYVSEEDAHAAVQGYTGEHSVWYEREPRNDAPEDLGVRRALAHYMVAIRCLSHGRLVGDADELEAGFEAFRNDVRQQLGG